MGSEDAPPKPAAGDGSADPISPRSWRCLQGITAVVALHAVAVLAMGIDQPLVDLHGFRQTQTALSTYWLARGGPVLAYETPVVGAPWAIPFEFPLFQALVALASAALSRVGVGLDAVGRATSFLFFLGSLWPLRMLFRRLCRDGPAFLLTATLFLACPTLLYWGRAFLMESCAVFFGLLWLALLAHAVDGRSRAATIAAPVVGGIAVLVKATTFPAFAVLGAALVAIRSVQARSRGEPWRVSTAVSVMSCSIPFAVGIAWVMFSDEVKSHNDLGRSLTSQALSGWNLGTWAQRSGATLWVDTVWDRMLPETLGLAFPVGIAALAAGVAARRTRAPVALVSAAFLLPPLLFTNLYIVHDYYQSANAVFLVAAVGIALAELAVAVPRAPSPLLLGVLVAGQLATFHLQYAPAMRLDGSTNRAFRVARLAREHTTPGESLIVIGDDWSSTVPYYAERKAIVLPPWAPAGTVDGLFQDPGSRLGDRPLGAVVYCADRLASYGALAPAIARFVAHRRTLGDAGGCTLLSPDATE